MTPKVSILIPIYNVSEYIERCATSLFEQSFDDIEFIFVNDATPDDSIEKLQLVMTRYPERKGKISIIHHEKNMGLAATRNTALKAARGYYIAVVDSDDYIEPDMIERMYLKAVECDADIVVSDIILEYSDKSVIAKENISENPSDHFTDMVINQKGNSCLWNKLIKRSLYLHPECRVPIGLNYYEDRYVMTRLFYFSTKIVKLERAFYHYNQYNTSAITKNKGRMHFENVIQYWNDLETFLKAHQVYEKFKNDLEFPKVQSKNRLMQDTRSSQLRKEYAHLFGDFEMKYLKFFKRGERMMMLLVRYRLFTFTQWLQQLSIQKKKWLK